MGVRRLLRRGLAAAHALHRQRQRVREATQRRIGSHGSEEMARMSLEQLRSELLHLGRRCEEQLVVRPKNGPASGRRTEWNNAG